MKLKPFILALPILAAGCAHTVGYKLTEGDRWTGPKIDGAVCVEPFVDHTVAITNEEEYLGKDAWRTNFRKGYDNTNLTAEVTAMIAKHLAYSGLFTTVVSGTETNADWFLSGTLADFQVHGRINHKAEDIQLVSSEFGLLGGLAGDAATAKMTSEIRMLVKLDDLNLADKAGHSVWHDAIAINTDTNVDFEEANEVYIFNFPDQSLKDAVNEMIHRLGNSSLTNHASVAVH
jgi:hypothetical protein